MRCSAIYSVSNSMDAVIARYLDIVGIVPRRCVRQTAKMDSGYHASSVLGLWDLNRCRLKPISDREYRREAVKPEMNRTRPLSLTQEFRTYYGLNPDVGPLRYGDE